MFNFNFEKCMEEILVEDNDPTEPAVSSGSDSDRVEVDLAEKSIFTPQSCSIDPFNSTSDSTDNSQKACQVSADKEAYTCSYCNKKFHKVYK